MTSTQERVATMAQPEAESEGPGRLSRADAGSPQLPEPSRERSVCRGISPWLAPVAMLATQDLALPLWFRSLQVQGQQFLPASGPVLLAPTHKARWDALLLPYAAGRRVSGRDCRFMVTIDEMQGLQGWFLQRLGCFAVNQLRPSLASLRYAVELLEAGEQLVVFPEGRIRREPSVPRLQQGLARLALLAESKGVVVPVLPVGIAYSRSLALPCGRAALRIGAPMRLQGEGREAAKAFTAQLAAAMTVLESQAAASIGVPSLPKPCSGAPDQPL
ncbi:1-acyl-sn-glycerol-3-phosphate acyltransferase [Cyanobium sp. LEGE 06113]|uniref:lysophospholipid acyltransferase family protein n=1 Tax=Cyanobium sp. LEGE 06113 TaxID=1297573 RepID=UPI001880BD4C|nr:lysophospholipid acyltransferase family protein [Cyanobium sp. LEGE 06113]MBE9153662.1 1-acyl-sn-glycerol-3-phosphate acyltransferase [Cyanobium sp. LEGE 06113]